MNTPFLLLIYGLILALLGRRGQAKRPDQGAFYFAGGRLGWLAVAGSITASWLGAAATLATLAQARESGFSALWLLGFPTLLSVAAFWGLTPAIRRLGFSTLPAFLEQHYGPRLPRLLGWVLTLYFILLCASQLAAWATFLPLFWPLDPNLSLLSGGLLLALYALRGGLAAVVRTDLLQLLLLGLALLALCTLGPTPRVHLRAGDGFWSAHPLGDLSTTLAFALAWTVSPLVWQRLQGARSTRDARRGLGLSSLLFSLYYGGLILLAVGLRHLPAQTGTGLPQNLPPSLAPLIFLGLASAILSTADSALNIGALTLQEDLLGRWRHRPGPILSSGLTLLLALGLARIFPSIIGLLGLSANLLACALAVPTLAALLGPQTFSPRAGTWSLVPGALWGLASGLQTLGLPLGLPSWPLALWPGLGLSLLGYALGHLRDRGDRKAI